MRKETEYFVTFRKKPIIRHHGTELVEIEELLKFVGATSLEISLRSATVKMNLNLSKTSQLTIKFREYEDEGGGF